MKSISREEFNKLDRDVLYMMFTGLQDQIAHQSDTIDALRLTIENLTEQIAILTNKRFGKSSENALVTSEQLSILDFGFNEAEFTVDTIDADEPEIETVIVKRKKRKGKREEDLSAFPVIPVIHELSKEELEEKFPDGYTELPDEVYKKLRIIPAQFEVLEHRLKVYKGKDGTIVKAPHPKELMDNSIATPSLVAFIMNGKYVNAVPLYRQEQEFERNDVNISRQTMANWVIRPTEKYLSLVYDRLIKEIKRSPVIHADETPVQVSKEKDGPHKNYMWVYRTGSMCKSNPAIVYDYQRSRNKDAPRTFLEGFSGKLVCDGYQVYHALENEKDTDFTVAGCWVHARRPFAEVIKAVGKDKAQGTLAYEAYVQIQNIYHTDNALAKLPPSERKKKRKKLVKPLVDTFFEWAKSVRYSTGGSNKTSKGIEYCLNQERYLRAFLDDPSIPLDNNIAEQAIRPFCVGRNNWKLIDTPHGAKASAMIYSLVETAKANNLNIYKYLEYLLTEIPQHEDDNDLSFIEDMLPWSKALPDDCRKKNKSE